MKKLLFSCLSLASMGAFAQLNYSAGFESDYSTTLYGQFGGGTQATAAACNGTYGGQLAISTTYANTGFMVMLNGLTTQTNNGQALSVTANYKKAAGAVGSISLAYMVKDQASGLWTVTPFGPSVSLATGALTSCQQLTGTIPAGALQPGAENGIGIWFTRSSGSGNVFVDDISFVQEVATSVPGCTTITDPTASATVNGGNHKLIWTSVPTAVNYKVTVGTTSGGSDVLNTTVAGTSLDASLPTNSNLFLKVVPSNTVGDATGCAEVPFTTNSTISYCGPLTSTSPAATYPISSVTFNGVTNTSAATVGSPAYEDYTAKILNGFVGSTYPLNVVGTGLGTNRFGMTVFIDWNNDGDFNDANEQYFTVPANYVGASGSATLNLTGNIAIPGDVTPGDKRMRIKYNFSSSTTSLHDALATPCSSLGNGQAEDYTLTVSLMTTPPTCTTITAPVSGSTIPLGALPTVIRWNAADGATGYKLTIGTTPGGSDVYSGTVTGTSYSASLNNHGATYYVKVVPTNANGDATGCTEISFSGCAAVSTFPLTEGFESTTMPACWNNVATSGAAVWASVTTNGNSTITPKSGARMAEFRTTTSGNKADLILPALNINSLSQPAIKFYMANVNWAGDIDELRVYYKNSASGTWTVIGTYTAENTAWKEVVLDLPNPSADYYVKFEGTSNWARGIDVDDITVANAPTLGVANLVKANASVYPNPFQDVLKISDIKGVKSINISDMSGRSVKTLAPASELTLRDLKSGLYIVSLQYEDGSVKTVKAIKK